MTMWCVRAGKGGEREEFNLDNGVVVNGWTHMGDMTGLDRDAIKERLRETGLPEKVVANHAGQLDAFVNQMQVGDYVALPLKRRSAVAVGRITGDYEYRANNPADAKQVRPVEWLGEPVSRSRFSQATLYTLGSALTIFRVQRNGAEQRVLDALAGAGREDDVPSVPASATSDPGEDTTEDVGIDIEESALDAIRTHLLHNFKGHKLEALVAALLRADGYTTLEVEPGPDGGIDVLAGRGPMGFESPRIAVQVKSTDSPVDAMALRHLRGAMRDFGADHGLFVSWGGFKRTVEKEARPHFFNVRLWDADALIAELIRLYDRLPADVQSEIPLKQVWTLVTTEA